jgi:hypothetical protein
LRGSLSPSLALAKCVAEHHIIYFAIQQNKIRENIDSLKGQYSKGIGTVHSNKQKA